MVFTVYLLKLSNIASLRIIHAVVCHDTLFFYIAVWYSLAEVQHNLSIPWLIKF